MPSIQVLDDQPEEDPDSQGRSHLGMLPPPQPFHRFQRKPLALVMAAIVEVAHASSGKTDLVQILQIY